MTKLTNLNYVTLGEKVIQSLIKKDKRGIEKISLTTSKIRNILSLVTNIYNEVIHSTGEILSMEMQGEVQYLKLRIIYEAGREPSVKEFVKNAELIEHIDNIKDKKDYLLLFCKYMEAIVAYRKYYGGDN